MSAHLFTYGSLMFAQVWQRVVQGRYRSVAASVAGFGRFAVTGQDYPGMVALPGASVRGLVYVDVDDHDIAALDAFEGTDYRRVCLTATPDAGVSMIVSAYVYRDRARLSTFAWDPGAFQAERFLESWCRPDRD